MATEGTVLWKCGACEDCFYDLQVFAAHKCVSQTSTLSLTEHCISDASFANAEIGNATSEQVEAITAIAALEEEDNSLDQESSSPTVSFAVAGKRNHKAKPTIISINNPLTPDPRKFKKHQKSKRSMVWTYFNALDYKKAVCCICQKVIAYCGTPTNLVYHLNRFHPNESEVVKSKQAGGAKYQYLQNKIPKLGPHNSTKYRNVTAVKSVNIVSTVAGGRKTVLDKIVELLVLDLQPASVIEGEGFKSLLQTIEPSAQIPNGKTVMKDLLPKRFYHESKRIKNELIECDTVHMSVELWTGYEGDDFLTMTSHFFTSDFDLKTYVLSTACLGKEKDVQAIATSILSCISDYDLTNNITCIVTNGNECLTKAVVISNKRHIVCLAHTLDTIIKNAINMSPELKKLIDKCQNLVAFLKHNEGAKQKLMEIQTRDKQVQSTLRDHLEFPDSKTPNCPLKPKKDNASYWNTIFYMFQRIFTLRNVIQMVWEEVPLNSPGFTNCDWIGIEETISLLKAFEMVTLELCSENFLCLSKVIPMVQGLLSLVQDCNNLTLPYTEKVRKSLLNQLQKKLGKVEENITLAVATILDPRFKSIAFQSEDSVEAAVRDILVKGRKYKNLHVPSNSQQLSLMDTTSSSYTDSLWESFEKKATPRKEASQSDDLVYAEIKNFFDEPLIDRKKSPSAWWKDCGSARYPVLSAVAKAVLSIPATSVPPKRVFMQKEQPFLERRKNIKRKYVNQMLFLNSNIE